ncbi:hypothetical protein GH714_018332 [Hevea brasiliensis]|uniref:Bet v I/Major latex protein domain-containing protein n=1 Tax=Hevea brasiliensis TaxID=3981 RepID=A0A6A6MNF8_HEVBR|nr:hypothetical protein GH714_018332 [Hevea brasiliensis]
MGVVTLEKEITVAILPKTFKVFVLESDTAIPSILPQAVKTVEIIEGNGGPGTIKKITLEKVVKNVEIIEGNGGPGTIKKTSFAEGREVKYIKTQIDATDKDNFTHCYSAIGGDPWMDALEKVSYEIKMVSSSDGGSIIKTTTKYYPKENGEINEDQIKIGAEKGLALFKAVEAYLLANPDAYN